VQNTSKDARPSVASRQPNQVSANGDPYFTSRMPMATASICRRMPADEQNDRDRRAGHDYPLGNSKFGKKRNGFGTAEYKPAVHRNCHPNKSNAPVSLSGTGNPKCAAAA